jgi:hypothetical protein
LKINRVHCQSECSDSCPNHTPSPPPDLGHCQQWGDGNDLHSTYKTTDRTSRKP